MYHKLSSSCIVLEFPFTRIWHLQAGGWDQEAAQRCCLQVSCSAAVGVQFVSHNFFNLFQLPFQKHAVAKVSFRIPTLRPTAILIDYGKWRMQLIGPGLLNLCRWKPDRGHQISRMLFFGFVKCPNQYDKHPVKIQTISNQLLWEAIPAQESCWCESESPA